MIKITPTLTHNKVVRLRLSRMLNKRCGVDGKEGYMISAVNVSPLFHLYNVKSLVEHTRVVWPQPKK